jgi:Sec-independent protein translocase protein TatA
MTNAFIAGLGPLELGIILIIVLVIVGGKRLPQLGGGVREFKDTVTRKADERFDDDDSSRSDAQAALGRPADEQEPLDGEVMRERS